MSKSILCVAAAAALCGFAPSVLARQGGPPRLIGLFGLGDRAHTVSGDGLHVAVGQGLWTESGGFVPLPSIGTQTRTAQGLNFNGSVAAVTGMNPNFSDWRAARVSGSIVQQLGTLPGFTGAAANGISSDGSKIVGYAVSTTQDAHGFYWTADTGLVPIGVFPGGTKSQPEAVSRNGQVIVGNADLPGVGQVAFRWTEAGGLQELAAIHNQNYADALAASADGSVMAGFSRTLDNRDRPLRWTTAAGATELPTLPSFTGGIVDGMSADGQVLVGYLETSSNIDRAAIWTPEGVRFVSTVLDGLGVAYDGWQFDYVTSISRDGTVICGAGEFNGVGTGFVAVIPSPASVCVLIPAMFVAGRRRR